MKDVKLTNEFITKGELSMNMLSIEQELKNNAYPVDFKHESLDAVCNRACDWDIVHAGKLLGMCENIHKTSLLINSY